MIQYWAPVLRYDLHQAPQEPSTYTRQTRHIEAFGRKVTTTAGHLIAPLSDPSSSSHYQNAMTELHKELRRPIMQGRVFSFAQASPTEIVRSKLSTSEIKYRALTYLPDELLANIPEDDNTYSLFQGFQAMLPEKEGEQKKGHRRHNTKGQKLLGENESDSDGPPSLVKLKKDKNRLNHQLEMMGVRKNMCSSEIREIDNKIANLNSMRRIVLDRLAGLEQEEAHVEHECKSMKQPALVTRSNLLVSTQCRPQDRRLERGAGRCGSSLAKVTDHRRWPSRRCDKRRAWSCRCHLHVGIHL